MKRYHNVFLLFQEISKKLVLVSVIYFLFLTIAEATSVISTTTDSQQISPTLYPKAPQTRQDLSYGTPHFVANVWSIQCPSGEFITATGEEKYDMSFTYVPSYWTVEGWSLTGRESSRGYQSSPVMQKFWCQSINPDLNWRASP